MAGIDRGGLLPKSSDVTQAGVSMDYVNSGNGPPTSPRSRFPHLAARSAGLRLDLKERQGHRC